MLQNQRNSISRLKRPNSPAQRSERESKIKPNDKLALIGFEKDSEICCIVMLKADALESTVKNMLSPVFKGVFQLGVEK